MCVCVKMTQLQLDKLMVGGEGGRYLNNFEKYLFSKRYENCSSRYHGNNIVYLLFYWVRSHDFCIILNGYSNV